MSGGPSSWVLITPGQHGQGQPWRPCLKHGMSPTLVIVTEQGYKSTQHISWHMGCVGVYVQLDMCLYVFVYVCMCICVYTCGGMCVFICVYVGHPWTCVSSPPTLS